MVSGMVRIPPRWFWGSGRRAPGGGWRRPDGGRRCGGSASADVGVGGEAGDHAADEGSEDRHPGVRPVARALAPDGEQRVRDAGAEVTGGVDGVPRRAAEAGTDADHEQGDGERAETRGRLAEGE